MNIVLIVSDTFRRDHLGCYGNAWIRTPNLDCLAQDAHVFERCYAASFPTVPCRADLLTGKYDFAYLGWAPLPKDEITLPKLLSQHDYRTAAVVDTPFYVRDGYGYDRGFDDFLWVQGQLPLSEHAAMARAWRYEQDRFAPTTLGMAEGWLEQHRNEKFFLLVDTWDPHEPWDAPEHYVQMYLPDDDGSDPGHPCYWSWKEAGLSERDVERAHAHYSAEITMVDRAVGGLVERLHSLGLLNDTAIIFTSDHGFYFGEHDLLGKARLRDDRWHWSPLYDEVACTPLIMRLPREKGVRIDALVSTPDIMPTILELAGVEVSESVQACSLLPLLRRQTHQVHDVVVTSWPLYNPGQRIRVVDDMERGVVEPLPSTIRDQEWTLIYATESQPAELYNTDSDPGQMHNILEGNEEIGRSLHAKFVELLVHLGVGEPLLASRRQLCCRSSVCLPGREAR
jgi:arylsulfatase A-like enzyme